MRVIFAYALKETVAIAVFGCLIAGGCGAVTALDYAKPDDTKSQQTLLVTVNRTNKGDQLAATSTSTIHANGSSSTAKLAASAKRPPLGCDPAFSPMADPIYAQIYKRCAA